MMVVHEHEDVYDAAAKMAAARCRRLPVVNTAGKLVGVVAIDDMVGRRSHTGPSRTGRPPRRLKRNPGGGSPVTSI